MSFMPYPGTIVRLTDGRLATVSHVTPSGKEDRVRFDDGHEEQTDAWKIAEILSPTPFAISGARLLSLTPHADARGRFVETYRAEWFPNAGMVQANLSQKRAGSVVGLHYHLKQADFWFVAQGRIRAVLHDLREGSPTYRATWQADLDAAEDRALYIPPGVAHGFAALTDVTLIYLIDRYFDPADELGVAWDDPEIGADWGVVEPVLSERDRGNPRRRAVAPVKAQAVTDRAFGKEPIGFRDLYWCWHLNEPVILQYRNGQSYCINCRAELLGDSESHTFIAHVYKPQ